MRYPILLSVGFVFLSASIGVVRPLFGSLNVGETEELTKDETAPGLRGGPETKVHSNEAIPLNLSNTSPRSPPRERNSIVTLGEQLFIGEASDDDYETGDNNKNPPPVRQVCDKLDRLEGLEELRGSFSEGAPERSKLFTDCMDALERAQQSIQKVDQTETCNEHEMELVHTFWDVRGDSGSLPKTALLGLLSMVQANRRGCVNLKVWVANERSMVIIQFELGKFLPNDSFSVERVDFGDLCDRIAHNFPDLQASLSGVLRHVEPWSNGPANSGLADFSNIFRSFVLSAYGGTYLDTNMVLLKPLTPLLSHDFYYRGPDQYVHTGALHLRLKSPNAYLIMKWILENPSIGWQNRVTAKLSPSRFTDSLVAVNGTLELLPSSYFDPVGVVQDSYREAMDAAMSRYGVSDRGVSFFGRVSTIDAIHEDPLAYFFPGAFAFHFQPNWTTKFVPGSTADLLLDEYKHLEEYRQESGQ